MPSSSQYVTSVSRFYIDVRPLVPALRNMPVDLPLLETLHHEQQTSITRYLRPIDRLMSLSSAFLKYYFIHRYALIPWREVRISKTPKPHQRPYWQGTPGWKGEGGLEFNVTHQNGLVAIVGCKTPTAQSQAFASPGGEELTERTRSVKGEHQIRLGVDVSCAHEQGRTPSDVTTQAKLDEWVNIFGEMFSEECLVEMKSAIIPGARSEAEVMQKRLRRFYAYWALKEAYIKMVGEGLLADWLRKLEFENVTAPEPAVVEDHADDGFSWALRDEDDLRWTPPERAVKNILPVLYEEPVHDVTMELVAYEQDFLLAVAMQGAKEENPMRWIKLDIEKDIRACAEGNCDCLDQKVIESSDGLISPVSATRFEHDQPCIIVEADVRI